MSPPADPGCTRAAHAEITADPDRFAAELVGHEDWPEAGLIAAHCPLCHSTLCREVDDVR